MFIDNQGQGRERKLEHKRRRRNHKTWGAFQNAGLQGGVPLPLAALLPLPKPKQNIQSYILFCFPEEG